jgi:hypothetical protein
MLLLIAFGLVVVVCVVICVVAFLQGREITFLAGKSQSQARGVSVDGANRRTKYPRPTEKGVL